MGLMIVLISSQMKPQTDKTITEKYYSTNAEVRQAQVRHSMHVLYSMYLYICIHNNYKYMCIHIHVHVHIHVCTCTCVYVITT